MPLSHFLGMVPRMQQQTDILPPSRDIQRPLTALPGSAAVCLRSRDVCSGLSLAPRRLLAPCALVRPRLPLAPIGASPRVRPPPAYLALLHPPSFGSASQTWTCPSHSTPLSCFLGTVLRTQQQTDIPPPSRDIQRFLTALPGRAAVCSRSKDVCSGLSLAPRCLLAPCAPACPRLPLAPIGASPRVRSLLVCLASPHPPSFDLASRTWTHRSHPMPLSHSLGTTPQMQQQMDAPPLLATQHFTPTFHRFSGLPLSQAG